MNTLSFALALESGSFVSGIGAASRSLGGMLATAGRMTGIGALIGAGLAGIKGSANVVQGVADVFKKGADLNHLSKQTGESVGTLYELQKGFQAVGLEGNEVCSDYVACFEYRHEAQAFEKAMKERLAKFGLEVAADKTKTLRFGRNGGPHNGRFDFLGFEFYWEPDRKGKPRVKRRTSTKKHLAAMERIREWIKEHRHIKLPELMKKLASKLEGTWNYYGIIGNSRRIWILYQETQRALYKWLNRRSQRKSLTWGAFNRMLKRFELPHPRIKEKHKQDMPCQRELSFCQRLMDFLKPGAILKANARAS